MHHQNRICLSSYCPGLVRQEVGRTLTAKGRTTERMSSSRLQDADKNNKSCTDSLRCGYTQLLVQELEEHLILSHSPSKQTEEQPDRHDHS